MTMNVILTCCLPLLNRIRPFFQKEAGQAVEMDFRDIVIADFVALESDAFTKRIEPQKVHHLKYAMAAFIDELVMNSQWTGRLEWMGRPLQLQLFGEHLAGEGFFNRLSQLRQAGQSETDLLEVYYLCLQLGFQGTYRMKDEEQLIALQAGLRSQIETARGTVDPNLSSVGMPQHDFVEKVGREVPFWVIAVLTCAVIFFIYLGYSVAMDSQAHTAVQTIKKEMNND